MSGLFAKLRKSAAETAAPSVPEGRRVYCIGDIHGMAQLLEELHGLIRTDAADFSGARTIVYLGDYVDRGEQSREVIDMLIQRPLVGFEHVFLLGNHERAMMDFIERPEELISWLGFGGRETLASYGMLVASILSRQNAPELARRLDMSLPRSHREFLSSCASHWRCGDYYFVHAGIRPGTRLEQQELEDQLWIRGEFLGSSKDHGAVVVHGHSISTEVEMLPNRIGIDTGAFATGVLTCLVLEGEERRLLQTGTGVG